MCWNLELPIAPILGNPQPRSYRVRVYYAEIARDGPIPELREIVQEKNGIQAGRDLVWNFDDGKLVCGMEIVDSTLAEEIGR